MRARKHFGQKFQKEVHTKTKVLFCSTSMNFGKHLELLDSTVMGSSHILKLTKALKTFSPKPSESERMFITTLSISGSYKSIDCLWFHTAYFKNKT